MVSFGAILLLMYLMETENYFSQQGEITVSKFWDVVSYRLKVGRMVAYGVPLLYLVQSITTCVMFPMFLHGCIGFPKTFR